MVPTREGNRFGTAVGKRQCQSALIIYLADEKQRPIEFSLKSGGCFFRIFRSYGAQQGFVFAAGKGVLNCIKIKTAAKFQQ